MSTSKGGRGKKAAYDCKSVAVPLELVETLKHVSNSAKKLIQNGDLNRLTKMIEDIESASRVEAQNGFYDD